MARPQVRCPSCGGAMFCDDCTRVGSRWVDIYICERCGRKHSSVVQETPTPQARPTQSQPVPAIQQAPPQRLPEPLPPPAPVEPPRQQAAPSVDRTAQLLERAMIIIGLDRTATEAMLADDAAWEERRGWDDFSEIYPLA